MSGQDTTRFKHRILIALCGTSPAVITETLWALATPEHRLHFVPTRVIVITTLEGRTELNEQLLEANITSRERGRRVSRIGRMAQDFAAHHDLGPESAPKFEIAAADVIVPRDDEGIEIVDAHLPHQLNAMREVMFDVLQTYTVHDDTAVTFSLSGGRKSMSNLAGQCMSALARPWDKLVHVVPDPSGVELASSPTFYYPYGDGPVRWMDPETDKEMSCLCKSVQLLLTEEPVFRLRSTMAHLARSRNVDTTSLTFSGMLALLPDPAQKPRLQIDLRNGGAWLSSEGRQVPLQFHAKAGDKSTRALLIQLARRRTEAANQPYTRIQLLDDLRTVERLRIQHVLAISDQQSRLAAISDVFKKLYREVAPTEKRKLSGMEIDDVQKVFCISDKDGICSIPEDNEKQVKDKAVVITTLNSTITHLQNAIVAGLPYSFDAEAFSLRQTRTNGGLGMEKTVGLPDTLEIELLHDEGHA